MSIHSGDGGEDSDEGEVFINEDDIIHEYDVDEEGFLSLSLSPARTGLYSIICIHFSLIVIFLAVKFVVLPDQDDDMEPDDNPGELALLLYFLFYFMKSP